MENMLGLFRCGHYNEVALLLRWPLSEVSLYRALMLNVTRLVAVKAVYTWLTWGLINSEHSQLLCKQVHLLTQH